MLKSYSFSIFHYAIFIYAMWKASCMQEFMQYSYIKNFFVSSSIRKNNTYIPRTKT